MSLRKQLELTWQGKLYKLLVTMEVIDRVDDKISTGVLLARQATGDVRFAKIAKFISIVLNEAGATTTQESVYCGMFEDGTTSMTEAQELLGYILSAFFPAQKKKDTVTKKKVTRTPRKNTRGKTSTS